MTHLMAASSIALFPDNPGHGAIIPACDRVGDHPAAANSYNARATSGPRTAHK